jgi:hypothetical protein
MSGCPHEIWERESDVADGSCPICLRAEIKYLRAAAQDALALARAIEQRLHRALEEK